MLDVGISVIDLKIDVLSGIVDKRVVICEEVVEESSNVDD
jgi:hypothetical protein